MNNALQKKKISFFTHIVSYFIFAGAVVFVAPFIGSEEIGFKSVLGFTTGSGLSDIDSEIFFNLRLPRVVLGFLAGGTLALVGAVFQALLRNPLATPYTLGVTGGSAIGAYLSIAFPSIAFKLGFLSSVQLFSFAGAGLTLVFIYFVAQKPHGISMTNLLLAGVTIGIICSAFLLLIRYLAEPNLLVSMDRWTMGSLDIVGYRQLGLILPMLLPGLGVLFTQATVLNHISFGQEMAMGHGINVKNIQRLCFFAGSLTTAAIVSVAGPIAFVGLLIPHITRGISGYDHRIILPASFVSGGAFLVLCDTIARTVIAPSQMPTGIITALIGGIFFIYLLVKKI